MTCFIKLKDISICYPIYGDSIKNWRGSLKTLSSAGNISKVSHKKVVTAIRDLTFEAHSGDRIALIGGNGAGKTTLLKALSGIYETTTGELDVCGKITTILGTGFGLDDEASGYQNILLGGIILGYSLNEIKPKVSDIESFTELGEFLNLPLRTYSAGMRSRLAFAIATCMDPEILLIDEGIAAGDASFFQKAQDRVNNFLSRANILIMASHSTQTLKTFCNKGVVLKNGELLFQGNIDDALHYYETQY